MRLPIGKLLQRHGKRQYCTAVVAAAGSSVRMGGQDKLFAEIAGTPVLALTLTALDRCPGIKQIVVVAREQELESVSELCRTYKIRKADKIITGGATRLESVYAGVLAASPAADLIAVHDGARPFVTEGMVSLVLDAAAKHHAAAPAVPVTSTVKQAKDGMVVKTIDRTSLFEVQTPQVFAADLIKGALQSAIEKDLKITDDCMAVEAIGCPVKLTTGLRENIKITTVTDIAFAEAIYARRSPG